MTWNKSCHIYKPNKRDPEKYFFYFYQRIIFSTKLGHNGAGKTTLTFILCGIHAPDSGSAYILGNNIFTFNSDDSRKKLINFNFLWI